VFALPVYDRTWQEIWGVSAELTATGWQTSVVDLAAGMSVRHFVRLSNVEVSIQQVRT
jgi:hypothetical protein